MISWMSSFKILLFECQHQKVGVKTVLVRTPTLYFLGSYENHNRLCQFSPSSAVEPSDGLRASIHRHSFICNIHEIPFAMRGPHEADRIVCSTTSSPTEQFPDDPRIRAGRGEDLRWQFWCVCAFELVLALWLWIGVSYVSATLSVPPSVSLSLSLSVHLCVRLCVYVCDVCDAVHVSLAMQSLSIQSLSHVSS